MSCELYVGYDQDLEINPLKILTLFITLLKIFYTLLIIIFLYSACVVLRIINYQPKDKIFLKDELEEVGFLHSKNKSKKMFENIQSLFLRSSLSKIEIQTLWGMIKKLRK